MRETAQRRIWFSLRGVPVGPSPQPGRPGYSVPGAGLFVEVFRTTCPHSTKIKKQKSDLAASIAMPPLPALTRIAFPLPRSSGYTKIARQRRAIKFVGALLVTPAYLKASELPPHRPLAKGILAPTDAMRAGIFLIRVLPKITVAAQLSRSRA